MSRRTGSRFHTFTFLLLAVICIILSGFSAYFGLQVDSSSAECVGVYEFKPTSSEMKTEHRTVKDHNRKNKKKTVTEHKYYLTYTAKGTKYSFQESVSQQTYKDFKNGKYNYTIKKSVWKVGKKEIIRYESENATESEVIAHEDRRKKYLFMISGILFSIGIILIITSVIKLIIRR